MHVDDVVDERLVSAAASDGVELDGVLIRPRGGGSGPVVIWIHGFGASFSFPPYLRLARALAVHGIASIVANTRGHDLGTLVQPKDGAPHWAGGLWERMEDSPRDLAAWVDFGVSAGFPAAVLLGHSLGAVKATYYLAERPDPRVAGLALASPPLRPSWDTRAHSRALAEAERLMAEGLPEALFAGPWGTVSAQTYVGFDRVGFDQFGRGTKTPNLARVRCPIFVAIGEHDEQVCTPADLDVLQRSAAGAPRVEAHVIGGADHFFTRREPEVAALLARWIGGLA